jgi:hypothetical protein
VNIDTLTLAMQCAHAMQQATRGDHFLFENEAMRIHQAILSSGGLATRFTIGKQQFEKCSAA